MGSLLDGDRRLEDSATATQRHWSNAMVVDGTTVIDVATAVAMDGKWTADGLLVATSSIGVLDGSRRLDGWHWTAMDNGCSMHRVTNETRRQHTTYCCLPLVNNTRMNGAMEMAENREANYSDASLG
jgi:hypothetical protein